MTWKFFDQAALWAGALGLILLLGGTASSNAAESFPKSYNDFGGVGLLQTRTARFAPDGQMVVGGSFVDPYQRYYFTIQALPWLEGSFRYTISTDEGFTQLRGGGAQTLVDRGADMKLKLLDESRIYPAMAVGFQDIGGTGLFDSEYLVLSKRFYNFDFSLGIAWGYLGSRGQLRNPLSLVSNSFDVREGQSSAQGGTVNFGSLFAGERVGLIGGIEYLTPIDGLRFKIELDGNDYKDEPTFTRGEFEVDSIFNFGFEYQPWSWSHMSLEFQRGNTLAFNLSLSTPLGEQIGVPKFESPPPPIEMRDPGDHGAATRGSHSPGQLGSVDQLFEGLAAEGMVVEDIEYRGGEIRVVVRENFVGLSPDVWIRVAHKIASNSPIPVSLVTLVSRSVNYDTLRLRVATDELYRAYALSGDPESVMRMPAVVPHRNEPSQIAAELFEAIEAEGYDIDAVEFSLDSVTLFVTQRKYRQLPRAVGRIARIAANTLPGPFEQITIVTMTAGLETNRITLLRADLENMQSGEVGVAELWHRSVIERPSGFAEHAIYNPDRYPDFSWSLAPKTRQHVGRPNEFIRFQIWARLAGALALARGLTINAALGADIYNDFDKIPSIPASILPNVRSRIVDYLQQGANNLVNLALHYVFRPREDWYGRLSVGYFEEMYMGLSGELLYRPYGSRLAIGLELNQVYQREFEQRFGLLEGGDAYDVVTGHLTAYYQVPVYDLLGAVHVGRYLAGDFGTTVELSRRFESGVRVGAWSTFTNVSSEEFGEGSFDKGFFISIPLELFFTKSSRQSNTFSFRPLTRDGGQRVNVSKRLYGLTGDADLGRLADDWRHIFQ